ncbi:MAG: hypothetical protein J7L98_04035 [Candidatus Verstraetearchaeota archaeon]|nr:hypothetical protein [Candidatus Verstraetearchaeota archaeon]
MALPLPAEVLEALENGRSFEACFEDDKLVIEGVRGIVKGSVSRKDVKGVRVSRRKPSKKQLEVVKQAAERLLEAKRSFKVVFRSNEVELRFDLDHYVQLYPDRCSVMGFHSPDEPPLDLIYDLLQSYGPVRLYVPKT